MGRSIWIPHIEAHVAAISDDLRVSPRVAGSIPSLATTSNSMIRNGFRVSPADHPGPSMADPRTIGKWEGGGAARRRRVRRVAKDRAMQSSCTKRPPSSPRWGTLASAQWVSFTSALTITTSALALKGVALLDEAIESNSRRRRDLAISPDCSGCSLRPHHAHARRSAGSPPRKDHEGRRWSPDENVRLLT